MEKIPTQKIKLTMLLPMSNLELQLSYADLVQFGTNRAQHVACVIASLPVIVWSCCHLLILLEIVGIGLSRLVAPTPIPMLCLMPEHEEKRKIDH